MHFSRLAARAALLSVIAAGGLAAPLPAADDAKPSDPSGKPTAVDSDTDDSADDASQDESRKESPPGPGQAQRKDLKNPVILDLPGGGRIAIDVNDPQAAELLMQSLKRMHVEPLTDMPASKFCLGIMVQNLTPEARAVLPVEGTEGVVVRETLPNGPAARAGLHEHDVITHVGDKPISDVASLVAAIDEAGEKGVEIRFLRKGEKQTVALTPELREKLLPEGGQVPQDVLENAAKENQELHDALMKLRKGQAAGRLHPGMMITRMGPGFVAGPGFVPGAGVQAEQIEKLTRTIDELTAEVQKLRTTVEQLQKQVDGAKK